MLKKAGNSGLFYLVMLPVFWWQFVVAVVFWRLAFAIMLRAFIVVRRLAFAIVLLAFLVARGLTFAVVLRAFVVMRRLTIMLLLYRWFFWWFLMISGESG
ncbi:hypothetical protein [Kluyvera ascorbata]|uniref:hypothetical protein n=1 Tax=Kluyvera ascorbata TaxID=51288 RepID=UPI0022DFD567|nr:hypothetical protein [Kluyvera ascorbata]